MTLVFLGVDLAGVETRPSGMASLDQQLRVKTWLRYLDAEILEDVDRLRPAVVGLDAPLGLPRGRESLEKRGPPHFRVCDIELRKRGIKFFPVTIGAMRTLTARGIKLAAEIRRRDIAVFEAYPGGIQDVLGLPRKHKNLRQLVKGLRKLGIKGLDEKVSGDEADAVTCAYAAYLWHEGRCEEIGEPDEGIIILPRAQRINRRNRTERQDVGPDTASS
ncbi:MAG: DUF429 domain-containing protein, partial [Candidatus Caldarchaeum sp.]|nr:DUF429 domain-containing protein [Candidatus Caldarchaeum sp.]